MKFTKRKNRGRRRGSGQVELSRAMPLITHSKLHRHRNWKKMEICATLPLSRRKLLNNNFMSFIRNSIVRYTNGRKKFKKERKKEKEKKERKKERKKEKKLIAYCFDFPLVITSWLRSNTCCTTTCCLVHVPMKIFCFSVLFLLVCMYGRFGHPLKRRFTLSSGAS